MSKTFRYKQNSGAPIKAGVFAKIAEAEPRRVLLLVCSCVDDAQRVALGEPRPVSSVDQGIELLGFACLPITDKGVVSLAGGYRPSATWRTIELLEPEPEVEPEPGPAVPAERVFGECW